MSSDSKTVQEQSDKLTNLIGELSAMISNSPVVPECIKLTVHEVTDGYFSPVSMLTEQFGKAAKQKMPAKFLQFNSIPITSSLENFKNPLILISDEMELDASTCDIVRKRAENGFITFPVIIFSDSFFKLTYGESCSYASIIDTFERSVKEKVMVFRKSDFEHIDSYLLCVSSIAKTYTCISVLKELYDHLQKEIEDSIAVIDKDKDAIASLVHINRVKAIQLFCIDAERIENKLQSQLADWNAEIVQLREQCDKDVLEMLMNIDADKLSSFVLNIDLKYGKLQEYICSFLNSAVLKTDYGFLNDDLKDLMNRTQSDVGRNTAKLSLIGTFSSGKTTLINTFLGERDVPLRTSMGHNTAVLMHLFYEPGVEEFYDIIYKDKLVWTVVKPASMEKTASNKENDKIRIISVDRDPSGGYLVRYIVWKTKETHNIRIRTTSSIIVKKGDFLNPGDPFTRSAQQISNNVEICSKDEINLLINHISKAESPKLVSGEGATKYPRNQIVNILKQIETVAGNKSSTIPYVKLCEALNIKPNINPITKKNEFPNAYRRLEVECKLDLKNERRMLDKKGWVELCGDPDPSNNAGVPVFSEMPECYMLAKELHLHIHTEFLQYCSLTDTPGFGSVTEEHDAITERYIRDNTGRLLVMIAVNAKTMDAKYQDLINSIDDIYNNFRGSDKSNVIFILNCFTNLAAADRLKKHVDSVASMLIRYGFSKKNIFVCNLHDALVKKQETETMLGFPSYKKFHDFIIQEMISSDLTKKYKGIKLNWDNFLRDAETRIDVQIYDHQANIDNAQNYKRRIQSEIRSTENVNVEKQYFTNMQGVFQESLDMLMDAYRNNRKGIFNTPRRNAITSALEVINQNLKACNNELREEITDYYQGCIDKLAYYDNTDISTPSLPGRYRPIVVLESESLKKLMEEADDETHWYNKGGKHSYYSDKVTEKLQSGYNQSFDNAVDYSDACYKVVCKYRDSIIHEKESILRNLKSEADIRRALEDLRQLRESVKTLDKAFKRIKFNL